MGTQAGAQPARAGAGDLAATCQRHPAQSPAGTETQNTSTLTPYDYAGNMTAARQRHPAQSPAGAVPRPPTARCHHSGWGAMCPSRCSECGLSDGGAKFRWLPARRIHPILLPYVLCLLAMCFRVVVATGCAAAGHRCGVARAGGAAARGCLPKERLSAHTWHSSTCCACLQGRIGVRQPPALQAGRAAAGHRCGVPHVDAERS